MSRPLFVVALAALSTASAAAACVGSDPVPVGAGPGAADAATSETGSGADGATPDGGGGGGDAQVDAGARCDPSKPFGIVERLDGISTANDESGVWVSADELTAYVATAPLGSSATTIMKSTRASRDVAFSAPATAPELVNVNANVLSVSSPSFTADGLVMAMVRDAAGQPTDGVFVSIRASTNDVFPVPTFARSRASNINALGDAFLVPGGESLFMARVSATKYDLEEAPRDVKMIYGDGGFVDYAVAPNVVNVNATNADDRHPVVSKDLLTLVFASNRAPGAGENTDLYLSTRAGPAGVFTAPVRLSEPISSDAADSPGTLSDDGCALYFTSKRAGGFGGWDVYVAHRPQ
ncbi:MAG: hypothetical protein R3B36_30470 [Polyangiaceae bacterium]